MTRALLIALLASAAAAPALAESVTIAPGLWEYSGSARLGAATLADDGTECFAPGQSTYSLREVAASIAPDCALASMTQTRGGFDFAIACTGDIKGELAGRFTYNQDTASLSATGWTGEPDQPVNLTVDASANRIAADCRQ